MRPFLATRWDKDTGGLESGDKIGARKFRVLKSWDFVRYPPSMDAQNPLPEGEGGAQAKLGRVRG
jgi:hypothetical protein